MPAPAPPPLALLRAHRVAAPAVSVRSRRRRASSSSSRSSPSTTRRCRAAPSQRRRRAADHARVLDAAPRCCATRRTQPLMLRAAVRRRAACRPGWISRLRRARRAQRAARRRARAGRPGAVVPLPLVPSAPRRTALGGFSIARQLGLGVSRIVIDPGHGGQDPGALGIEDDRSRSRARRRAAAREAARRRGRRRSRADAAHRRLHSARGAHGDRQPPGRRSLPLDSRQLEPQPQGGRASRPTSSTSPTTPTPRRSRRARTPPPSRSMHHLPDMVRAITPGQQARRVTRARAARSRNRW